ncbi:hypothetical protein ACFWN1_23115 [Streptomyces sp. NPDC058459]|uniref:hypothetical protein n=1 Tax=Streptomyces sp. NPDC058459 TaxID=3346508 RepID=UPI00364D68FE
MRRPLRPARLLLAALMMIAGIIKLATPAAHAADEPVTAWLTTTGDSAGRHVVHGLEP